MRILMQYVRVFDTSAGSTNNAHVNNRDTQKADFADRLSQLLQLDRRIQKKPDGDINVSQAAKAMGMEQPTLARMLQGKSDLPNRANAEKLTKFLNVSLGQLVGLEPISEEEAEILLERFESSEAAEAVIRELLGALSPEQRVAVARQALADLPDAFLLSDT